jgi:5'-nucleotidase
MNILVTNDDGIDSPGLWALAEAMSRVGETLVVAPNKEQSGVGTSVTLYSGMSIEEVPNSIEGVRSYAVGGTPSDCVIIGLKRLAQGRIGLVVSGINMGANVGNDIPYSGTVMATLQGYFRKIPSIAISLAIQEREEEPRFDVVTRVAECLALNIKDGKVPTNAILNTNVPNIPLEEIRGIVTTRAASSGYVRVADIRGSGNVNYTTIIGKLAPADLQHQVINAPAVEEGTDIWAINSGFVSITPLRMDVTHHEVIPSLGECISGLESELMGRVVDESG